MFILNQIRVRVEKDPELGFSISGGVGGRGNPFRPDDDVSCFLICL
jgi:erbb2-interacting protein